MSSEIIVFNYLILNKFWLLISLAFLFRMISLTTKCSNQLINLFEGGHKAGLEGSTQELVGKTIYHATLYVLAKSLVELMSSAFVANIF